VLLLALIFAVAQMTGAHLGPLTTSPVQVAHPGTSGMNMDPGR